MILNTNVLIKLERELRRGLNGVAIQFFESLPETRFCITPTIAGEFASGASLSSREVWEKALFPYQVLAITDETAWIYGEIYRDLSARGELIGTNDLWIAATALSHGMPVATGNAKEFKRVADLEIIPVGKTKENPALVKRGFGN